MTSLINLSTWRSFNLIFSVVTACRYNGRPHGLFSIDSRLQSIVVLAPSLQRQLLVNITRAAGRHARVRVDFALRYDQVLFSSRLLSLPVNYVTWTTGPSEMGLFKKNLMKCYKIFRVCLVKRNGLYTWGDLGPDLDPRKFFPASGICSTIDNVTFHYNSPDVSTVMQAA